MLSSDEDSDLEEELVAQWDELTRPLNHQGPKISAAREAISKESCHLLCIGEMIPQTMYEKTGVRKKRQVRLKY